VPGQRDVYVAVGYLGPSIVGLMLVFALGGGDGVLRMLTRMLPGDVHPFWFVFALFGGLVIGVPGILVSLYIGDGGVLADASTLYQIVVSFASIFVFSYLGEEIGWRGFALPRMQRDAVAVVAGLVVGVLWGVWYLPLWYMPGSIYQSIPLPIFFVEVVGVSVLCTWLYNNTGGNLLVTSLFHAASFSVLGLIPIICVGAGLLPMLASAGVLWGLVGVIVVIYGPTYLSRDEKYSFLGGFSWEYED